MFRMMVVDDNPKDRRGITELIDWGGLDIEIVGTAMNGELGFRKALELKPDFVLTDVAMPRMNGIKMTEKIREELPETRFIYMSCFDDVTFLQGAIDQEVSAYLLKPIDTEEMMQAVRKLCSRKQHEQSKKQSDAELLRLLTDNLPRLREQLLLDILSAPGELAPDASSQLSALHMEMNGNRYAVGMLGISTDANPHYHGATPEQRRMLMENVRGCLQETVLAENKGYMACPYPETLVWVRKFEETDEGRIARELEECVNRCLELTYDRYDLLLHAQVGEVGARLQDLPVLYRRLQAGEGRRFEMQIQGIDAGRHMRIVADIKRIVDSRYRELENVNQIVDGLFLSASHANHIFKSVTGQTIFDYLVHRKMEIAARMLQNPYVKVNEIPEKIGYKSDAHFRSVFKSIVGMTPKVYQDRHAAGAGVLTHQ